MTGYVGVTMDMQLAFNIVLALAAGFGGYILNSITTNLRQITSDLRAVEAKVQDTRETYVPKTEHKADIEGLRGAIRELDVKVGHGMERLGDKIDDVLKRLPHPPLTQ